MGRPPPIIWAMPERKRFFTIDVFPYSLCKFVWVCVCVASNCFWISGFEGELSGSEVVGSMSVTKRWLRVQFLLFHFHPQDLHLPSCQDQDHHHDQRVQTECDPTNHLKSLVGKWSRRNVSIDVFHSMGPIFYFWDSKFRFPIGVVTVRYWMTKHLM